MSRPTDVPGPSSPQTGSLSSCCVAIKELSFNRPTLNALHSLRAPIISSPGSTRVCMFVPRWPQCWFRFSTHFPLVVKSLVLPFPRTDPLALEKVLPNLASLTFIVLTSDALSSSKRKEPISWYPHRESCKFALPSGFVDPQALAPPLTFSPSHVSKPLLFFPLRLRELPVPLSKTFSFPQLKEVVLINTPPLLPGSRLLAENMGVPCFLSCLAPLFPLQADKPYPVDWF